MIPPNRPPKYCRRVFVERSSIGVVFFVNGKHFASLDHAESINWLGLAALEAAQGNRPRRRVGSDRRHRSPRSWEIEKKKDRFRLRVKEIYAPVRKGIQGVWLSQDECRYLAEQLCE